MGESGERIARDFLINKGYQILEQNLSFKNHEIDLIALDKRFQEIVFVEVKTRQTSFYGNPSQAVNRAKLRSLQFVAHRYLYARGLRNLYRFDIIAVTPQGVEHFENVTWP
ncbi:MAG TPA: YraN family protein [Patescibacteria group bacterium]|jgi:putative endonuclease